MCLIEQLWDYIVAYKDSILALSTFLLATFTAWMAWSTRKLANESRDASFRQIGVQTWLEMIKRFDSLEMKKERYILASLLQDWNFAPPLEMRKHISETVLNFFEDVGTLYVENFISKTLVKETFGFYARRWWHASKKYVDNERIIQADSNIYGNFGKMVLAMETGAEVIDEIDLTRFIRDEIKLRDLFSEQYSKGF